MIEVKFKEIIEGFEKSPTLGLTSLYQEYGRKLYGFTLEHFPLDEDEAYEVLYKTLETVGRVIGRYEFSSENHFANWLFKIHKNNIFQLLRKRKQQQTVINVDFSNWVEEDRKSVV